MAMAIKASLDEQEEKDLQVVLEESRTTNTNGAREHATPKSQQRPLPAELSSDTDDDLYADFTPSRLDTALRFANTGLQVVNQTTPPKASASRTNSKSENYLSVPAKPETMEIDDENEEDDLEEVIPYESAIRQPSQPELSQPGSPSRSTPASEQVQPVEPLESPLPLPAAGLPATPRSPERILPSVLDDLEVMSDDDDTWPIQGTVDPNDAKEAGQRQHEEGWDAAQEMNVIEEENDFARFAAQVKGRDLDAVRQEIDNEIRQLNKERKAAMRDSEDVTQGMVAQIMVCLLVGSLVQPLIVSI